MITVRGTTARYTWVLLLTVALLSGALAACSSSGSDKAEPTTTASTTTTSTTEPLGPAGEAFCKAAVAAVAAENAVNLENGTPQSVETAVVAAIAKVKAAQKLVPAEFQDVFASFLARMQNFQQVLADNNYDVAMFKSSAAGKAMLDNPQLANMFQVINSYLDTRCGGAK